MANLIKLRRSAVTGAVPTTAQLDLGELAINTHDGKLFLKRDNGIGQYIVEVGGNLGFEVKNQTGSTITKGTVLKFAGTLGASGKLLAAPFLANNTDPSEYVIGLAENDILNGDDGFAIDHGKILHLNTSAFSEGAILYASASVAGDLTATRPAAPNNKVIVAAVVRSHATTGILEVKVVPGSALDNDELVELNTLADGDTLVWNATNGRFENEQPSGGGSGSSVTVSDTPPSSPQNGDQWFNSTNATLNVYYVDIDGGQWVSVSGPAGGGSGSSVTVSDTPPSSPQNGDQWFNSANATLNVYYVDIDGGQWVAVSGPAGPTVYPGAGIAVSTGTTWDTSKIVPTGDIVGTSDTQTLTNKTFTDLVVNGTVDFSGALTSGDLADAVGYKGIPQNAQGSGYTLALSDMGKHISISSGDITIPDNGTLAFPIGATIVIYNDSATTKSILITTDTLRLGGSTSTGTRTLSSYGVATLMKVTSTTWVVTGNVT